MLKLFFVLIVQVFARSSSPLGLDVNHLSRKDLSANVEAAVIVRTPLGDSGAGDGDFFHLGDALGGAAFMEMLVVGFVEALLTISSFGLILEMVPVGFVERPALRACGEGSDLCLCEMEKWDAAKLYT